MYNVLLADDEKVILRGISEIVDWEQYNTRLVGTAMDGEIALDMIRQNPPDIVISDIKMPGMDGLELIRHVRELYPHIRFIILSGYEEFDFAKRAMEYGVKHYLLKPCNEHKIADVLKEVVAEIKESRTKEEFIRSTRERLDKVMPQVKEQILKEFLTNKTYGRKEWEYYQQWLQIEMPLDQVKLMLFEIEGTFDFEHVFALKNISTELIGQSHRVLLDTNIGERVAILMEHCSNESLFPLLNHLRHVYSNYYGKQITVAISDSGEIGHLLPLYKQCQQCLSHRFYLGEGALITHQDIQVDDDVHVEMQFDHDELSMALQSGDKELANAYVLKFFTLLRTEKVRIDLAKAYTLELFMVIVRQARSIDPYMKRVGKLEGVTTLQMLETIVAEVASEVASSNYDAHTKSRSRIVRQMTEYVQQHLSDESFSLNKLASEMMYMNADYLGKLFKREIGQRFTNYLVQERIERAKQLIREADEVKVSEIAEQVGYGNNPQYFSQVFKKLSGQSPSEYKKQPHDSPR